MLFRSIAAFTTLKTVPTVSLGEFTSDEEYLYPKIIVNDPDHAVMMARITVNNKKYNFDLDDDTKVVKIGIPKDATEIKCIIDYAYRLGDDEGIEEGRLELNYQIPVNGEDPSKGCSCSVGAAYIVSLGGLALATLIFIKRKHY